MNRKKLFLENIFSYGFINIINKIVPFLLIPIITRILKNPSDFGVYNIYTTVVNLGTPLAILGLYDAMFREFFEKSDLNYKYNVVSTAQRIIMISSIIISLGMIFTSQYLSTIFFDSKEYYLIFILAGITIFISSNRSPISAPTRMQNQRKIYVYSGLISSFSLYGLALLLIYFGYSYFGLIYASIFSAGALLFFFLARNYRFIFKGKFDFNIAKELLKIGLPLLPTFLIYWIYNSVDKIMILSLLDSFQVGIYSIGANVAQISTLIYAAFAGGYQYFAFSTMKDKDQVQLNSKVFDYLGALSILCMIVIYPFINVGFNIIFEGDYVLGYIVVPYLFISPLMLMLFQITANQFLVIRKSYYATVSLAIGAIVNVFLNYFLIKSIGIEGAAIATFTGYFITIFIVIIISLKLRCMIFKKRIIILLIISPVYLFSQRILSGNNIYVSLIIMILFVIPFIWFYRQEISILYKKIKNRF